MRVNNKLLKKIVILVLIIICGFIIFKPKQNEKIKTFVNENQNKQFAMYIKNENEYEEYDGTKFPEGYDLDIEMSKCVDNNGKEVDNILSYKNGEVTVTSGKTTYCYLYFYLPEEKEFEYTGNYQVFIAPKTGNYEIELWGASGGNAENTLGGKGAYTKGTIELEKNDKLYIYVGESGKGHLFGETRTSITYSKTYNGGGTGHEHEWTAAASGGGATDVRLNINETDNWDNFDSLKSRIMVAAGGGGGLVFASVAPGGFGGALIGGNGKISYREIQGEDERILEDTTGGTQTSGGIPNDKKTEESFGKFGKGGNNSLSSSGGGGGYYGGAGGSDQGNAPSSGAGGSSFISGYKGCIAIEESSTEGNIKPKDGCINEDPDVKCSYHYSGKVFTNMEMKAGNESMPTYDGNSTMIGNTGNGYAKIKLVQ